MKDEKLDKLLLDSRERKVLEMRGDGKTFSQIGEHFGLSRTRISQIQAKGARKKNSRDKLLLAIMNSKKNKRFEGDD